MSKLLHIVFERRRKMNESWQDSFEKINIDGDVNFLYQQGWTLEFANRVFAFVVLAYDKDSGWIDIHKNRLDNKRKIMQKLGGDLKDQMTNHVIENGSLAANNLKAWFMAYQRDWRWDTIMTCFDYHAEMMAFGGFKTMQEIEDFEPVEVDGNIVEEKTIRRVPVDKLTQGNKDKGSNIEAGIKRRQQGEELLEQIKKEFGTLDTALEKEGYMRITDAHDTLSWESFIRGIRSGT